MAANNDFSTLSALLERTEIDVNRQDKRGNTALHYAIFNNGKRRINALLTNVKINIDIPNNLGQTAKELNEGQDICLIS